MKGRAAARTGPGQRGLSHQGGIRYGKAAQTREVSLLSFIKLQVLIFLMQEKLSVSSRHIPGWALPRPESQSGARTLQGFQRDPELGMAAEPYGPWGLRA